MCHPQTCSCLLEGLLQLLRQTWQQAWRAAHDTAVFKEWEGASRQAELDSPAASLHLSVLKRAFLMTGNAMHMQQRRLSNSDQALYTDLCTFGS